jgi:hypothetical protein
VAPVGVRLAGGAGGGGTGWGVRQRGGATILWRLRGGGSPGFIVYGGASWPVMLIGEGPEERQMLELELPPRFTAMWWSSWQGRWVRRRVGDGH